VSTICLEVQEEVATEEGEEEEEQGVEIEREGVVKQEKIEEEKALNFWTLPRKLATGREREREMKQCHQDECPGCELRIIIGWSRIRVVSSGDR
jgi:hypothetical protein